jgi:hypothetical protein
LHGGDAIGFPGIAAAEDQSGLDVAALGRSRAWTMQKRSCPAL